MTETIDSAEGIARGVVFAKLHSAAGLGLSFGLGHARARLAGAENSCGYKDEPFVTKMVSIISFQQGIESPSKPF